MALLILTVETIPDDDPDNRGLDEPYDDEWVLYDDRGEAIAAERCNDGPGAADILQAMVTERKIFADWTDIQPAGTGRWTVAV